MAKLSLEVFRKLNLVGDLRLNIIIKNYIRVSR